MDAARGISVIIPARHEGERLSFLIRALLPHAHQVIVSVPHDDAPTAAIAEQAGATVVRAAAGRGAQLIAGAQAASGGVLFFCHADTVPPPGWADTARELLERPGVVAGAYRLRIDADGVAYRWIETVANLRSRLFGLPYGDQGLFVTRAEYDAAGGYAPLPLMEDVDMVRRLARRGSIAIVRASAATSARRWQSEGVVYCTLRNWTLMGLWLLGVSPATLTSWYRRRDAGQGS